MPPENPYRASRLKADAISPPPASRWRIPLLIAAAAVASVPVYGYFVHASRDPQYFALIIILCWLLTWPLAIAAVLIAVIRPPTERKTHRVSLLLIGYLFIAGAIGYGGVRGAFFELLAG